MKNKALLLVWIICTSFWMSCRPAATETLEDALKIATFPIFGADSYTTSTKNIGYRRAHGRVYFSVRKVATVGDLSKITSKYLICVEDDLVREMVDAELTHQVETPNRSNIPLFFMGNERFRIVEVADGKLKTIEQVELQNIKLVRAKD